MVNKAHAQDYYDNVLQEAYNVWRDKSEEGFWTEKSVSLSLCILLSNVKEYLGESKVPTEENGEIFLVPTY